MKGKKDPQMSIMLLNALLNNAWMLEYHGDADYRRKNRKGAPLREEPGVLDGLLLGFGQA